VYQKLYFCTTKNTVVVSEVASKLIVPVPCAIIESDGRILVAQRSALGSLPLKWEFPGGKLESGETEEEGLAREIMEELSVHITIGTRLPVTSRDDGWREIHLVPFVCRLAANQKLSLNEHEEIRWLAMDELHTVDWAEADRRVVVSYKAYLREREAR